MMLSALGAGSLFGVRDALGADGRKLAKKKPKAKTPDFVIVQVDRGSSLGMGDMLGFPNISPDDWAFEKSRAFLLGRGERGTKCMEERKAPDNEGLSGSVKVFGGMGHKRLLVRVFAFTSTSAGWA